MLIIGRAEAALPACLPAGGERAVCQRRGTDSGGIFLFLLLFLGLHVGLRPDRAAGHSSPLRATVSLKWVDIC